MGPFDPQRVEQADCIVGHIRQVVGRRRHRRAAELGRGGCEHVVFGAVKVRRQAAIAIVEADYAQAETGKAPAQRLVPGQHLHRPAADQQQRRIAVASEAFVFDEYSVCTSLRHAGPPHRILDRVVADSKLVAVPMAGTGSCVSTRRRGIRR